MLPWVPEADGGQCCPRPCTAEEQAFLEASAEIQGCLAPLTAPCSDWVSVTAGLHSQGSVDMAISFSGNSQNKWEERSTGARDYRMSSDADKKTQTSKKTIPGDLFSYQFTVQLYFCLLCQWTFSSVLSLKIPHEELKLSSGTDYLSTKEEALGFIFNTVNQWVYPMWPMYKTIFVYPSKHL